jgi:hypothetical protein
VFRLFVVETVAVSTPGIHLAVRVHEGTVRIGNRVTTAVPTAGEPLAVDLEVRYLSMTKSVHVEALDENYGGLATLFGLCPQGSDRAGN